jgi:aryl-alcohol dehydrogenase-like predicted oxidoreductase
MGVARYDSVQPRYNLLFREIERELLPLCLEEGIGVIPYNPIAGGFLSGKHSSAAPPAENTRFGLRGGGGSNYRERYWHDHMFGSVEELRPVAAEAGMPLAQMAVAWTLAHPAITSPIIGASKPEQLDDSVNAEANPLAPELKARLDEMTAIYRQGDHER